ncbi:MAG: hypothetical protein D6722_09640 [Bacteroidetes bacterium]|nr:MAG: hypothetical protein D6722_09640 [Bacteroidota bacterium]
MASNTSNRNYYILGALAILTIIAFLLINYFSGRNQSETMAPTVENLNEEILQLESSLLELELVVQDQEMETSDLRQLLQEKYDQITFMEQRIEELEQKGQVDEATIARLRQRVETFRQTTQLYERYKIEINELVIDNNRMARIIDTVVPNLQQALIDCQDGRGVDPGLLQENISPTNEVPTEEMVPVLRADNFVFTAQKGRKETEFTSTPTATGRVKSKDLENLEVCFDLIGNALVDNFEDRLFLRVENPDGEPYRNREGKHGLITVNGIEKVYTTFGIANYRKNQVQQLCIPVMLEDGQNFVTGFQTVRVYYQGKELGQVRFLIQ